MSVPKLFGAAAALTVGAFTVAKFSHGDTSVVSASASKIPSLQAQPESDKAFRERLIREEMKENQLTRSVAEAKIDSSL